MSAGESGDASSGPLLRGLLSIALLIWVGASVDLSGLGAAFRPLLIWATLGAGVLVLASALPAAERWRIIARDSGVELSRLESIRVTVLSYLALQFAPSTLGADAVRLASLRRLSGRWSAKTASVLVDRAYGVLSIILLAPVSAAILWRVGSLLAAPALLVGLLACIAVGVALALSFLRPPRAWLRMRPVRGLSRVVLAFRRACLDWRIAGPALALSFVTQALCMLAFWLVLVCAGAVDAGAGTVLGGFPAASLLALAPVSVNGWGVREASMVPLLAAFQIAAPIALAASLAYGVACAVAGALGAILWLGLPGRPQVSLSRPSLRVFFNPKFAYTLGICLGLPLLVVWLVPSSLNQADHLDPSLYSALMHNYGELLQRFGPTYYANRIAHIFPATLFLSLFGDEVGYFLHHVALLALIISAVYMLVRRFLGTHVATIAALVTALGPWPLRSFLYDYVEGTAIAYLLAGFAFATTAPHRKWASIVAGAFFALAVNVYSIQLAYGGAFFFAWLVLVNESWRHVVHRMFLVLVGFVLCYAIMSVALYRTFPAVGPFFEATTYSQSIGLLAGGASSWHLPLSVVIRDGAYYAFLPLITFLLLAVVLVWDRKLEGAARRFQLASLIHLGLVCVGLLTLHFVVRAGTLFFPHAMAFAFPATVLGWASIVAPSTLRLAPTHRVLLVAGAAVVFSALFLTARFWLPARIDNYDQYLLLAFVLIGSMALAARVRATALTAMVLAFALLPYRHSFPESGHPKFFYEMHRGGETELVERDVMAGGRALIDLVARYAPLEEGSVGIWHAAPPPSNYTSLTSYLFWGYSLVMSDVGMPDINDAVAQNIANRGFLVVLAPDVDGVERGLEALRERLIAYTLVRQGEWTGQRWGYRYAILRISPEWERTITATPDVLQNYRPGSIAPTGYAEVATDEDRVRIVTDYRPGAFSTITSLGDAAAVNRPLYLRVRLRVESGMFTLVLTKQNWPADYQHFTRNVGQSARPVTVYLPVTERDALRQFIVANGSASGASVGEIYAVDLVTRPVDAP